MELVFTYEPELQLQEEHWAIALHAGSVFTADGRVAHRFSQLKTATSAIEHTIHLGSWDGTPCFLVVFQTGAQMALPQYELLSLRSQLGVVSDSEFLVAGRAEQLAHWLDQNRYCGRCAAPTILHPKERALLCSQCNNSIYPQISPCVMGLVVRQGRCLLARHAHAATGFYSLLAGFIEPGETAEQALIREVQEEVGLQIRALRYVDSQSWPFPSQLMLAFVAYSDEGAIQVDGEEIVHADWFEAGHLPVVPPSYTLSGRIIRMFTEGKLELA